MGNFDSALAILQALQMDAESSPPTALRMELLLRQLVLGRRRSRPDVLPKLIEQAEMLLLNASYTLLKDNAKPARRLAAELGPGHTRVLARVLDAVGLGVTCPLAAQYLGEELAKWDGANPAAGLTAKAGILVPRDYDRKRLWQCWVQFGDLRVVGKGLAV